jgi:PAS domain S-box-containing protein
MKAIVDGADKLERESSQTGADTEAKSAYADLFDQKQAVITAIVDNKRLGEIISVNLGAVDMFGYTNTSEMLGKRLTDLMPAPFNDQHDAFISRYLETGTTSVLDNTRMMVVRDKFGFLFPVDLRVKQVLNDDEIHFIGIMSRKYNATEYVIADPAGFVMSVSHNILNLFKRNELALNTDTMTDRLKEIHISEWLTNWEQSKQFYAREQGLKTVIYGNQTKIKTQSLSKVADGHVLIEFTVAKLNMPHVASGSANGSGSDIGTIDSAPRSHAFLPLLPETEVASEDQPQAVMPMEEPRRESKASDDGEMGTLSRVNKSPDKRFVEAYADYMSKYARVETLNVQRSVIWIALLLLLLITVDIGFNMTFIGASWSDVSELLHFQQNFALSVFELVHLLSLSRTVQLLSACSKSAVSPSDVCVLVDAGLTSYNLETCRAALSQSALSLGAIEDNIRENGFLGRDDIFYELAFAPRFTSRFSVNEYRRSGIVSGTESVTTAYDQTIEYLKMLTANGTIIPFFLNSSAVRQLPLNVTSVGARSMFWMLENTMRIFDQQADLPATGLQIITDATSGLSNALTTSMIGTVTGTIIAFLVILYPAFSAIATWRRHLLTTLGLLPNDVMQAWHKKCVRTVENDAKDQQDYEMTTDLQNALQYISMNDESRVETVKSHKAFGIVMHNRGIVARTK